MSKTALVVVDVQYDFLPGGSLAVTEGDDILPILGKLLKGTWDFVVASKDFHPLGHVSFASTHGKEPFTAIDVPNPCADEDSKQPRTIRQMLWPDHCVQHSHGSEIEKGVLAGLKTWFESGKGLIVEKGTSPSLDVYSAFGTTPCVPPIEGYLTTELRKREIWKIFIVGLATDYCVRATALDAALSGFDVYVIKDGVRAVGAQEATLQAEKEFRESGIRFVDFSHPEVQSWM